MSSPTVSRLVSAAGTAGDRWPSWMHRDPVGDLEQLVEILADHQHRGAAAGEIDQRLPDGGGGQASTPQVGWLTTSTPGSAQDLAADHELLQVAAGQRAGGRVGPGLAHVEGARSRPRRAPARRRGAGRRSGASRAGGVAREHDVLRQAEGRGGGMAVALLRHEGGAAPPPRVDAEAPDGDAVDAGPCRARGASGLAGQGGEQLRLPVAGDAGDADDLAAADARARRRAAPCRAGRGRAGSGRRARAAPARPAGRRGRLTSPTSAPTIMAASERALSSRGSQAPTTLPPRRMVARGTGRRTSSSRCEMYRSARPSSRSRSSVGEQPLGLLRRQHRGRLVEDERGAGPAAGSARSRCAGARRPTASRPAGRGRGAARSRRRPRAMRSRARPRRSSRCGMTSAMFSATVRFSNSEKCWNTMPMPSARAASGLASARVAADG